MAPPPEIIDLSSSSDEEDEDLKKAIKMSLEDTAHQETRPAHDLTPTKKEPERLPEHPQSDLEKSGQRPLAAFGSMLLDRKKMEEERQARLAKKRLLDSPPSGQSNPSQKPKLVHRPTVPSPVRTTIRSPAAASKGEESRSTSKALPYARGAVKRTWTYGCERKGDDIKIEEVLQKSQLKLAVLASYVWDEEWLLTKVDASRTKLLFVAFAKDEAQKDQIRANAPSENIRFCFPRMGPFGTMHAKLQLLKFTDYLRIVVPTGNLTRYDWGETGVLENMVFLIDLPLLDEDAKPEPTEFSIELCRFLRALGLDDKLVRSLEKYDFSETKRYGFVHTICGSHTGDAWKTTGYCGLGRTVNKLGLASDHRPVEVDFVCSSIGSLKREYLSSLYSACKGISGADGVDDLVVKSSTAKSTGEDRAFKDHFRVYFPSQDTVNKARGGPGSAGTICLQSQWWDAHSFPRELFRDSVCKRTGLLIHSKVLLVRHTLIEGSSKAWAYIGSANLSESAWGRLSKVKPGNAPKMTCRNWECGVVLQVPTPSSEVSQAAKLSGDVDPVFGQHIPMPIETPGVAYTSMEPGAKPWLIR